jgi:hypothetical protein
MYIHPMLRQFVDLRSPLHRETLESKIRQTVSFRGEKLNDDDLPNRGARDAHGSTDWDAVLRCLKCKQRQIQSQRDSANATNKNDGNGTSQLHTEPSRRAVQGDTIAQDGHDVVSVRGETENKSRRTVYQHPDFDVAFLASGDAVLPGVVYDGEWTNCVTQIIGTRFIPRMSDTFSEPLPRTYP